MYSLPDYLAARFNLYLNVLPVLEVVAKYVSFAIGAGFIFLSFYRLLTMKSEIQVRNRIGTQWLDEDVGNEKALDLLHVEKRKDMSSKELEVYYSSLIAPMDQELSYLEFSELKEEVV